MKLRIFNINYYGHDFCCELSAREMTKIFDEASKELIIDTKEDLPGLFEDVSIFELDYNIVKDIVNEYCDVNGLLEPCSYSKDVPEFEWECLELNEYEKELTDDFNLPF